MPFSELAHMRPAEFVKQYARPIKVFAPGTDSERTMAAGAQALEKLAQGNTLYLVDYHECNTWCAGLVDAFQQRFGLTGGRASIFISSHRAYMPFHWDRLNNFTWQIAGSKRWILAPNSHVRFPLENHALGRSVSKELLRSDGSSSTPTPERREFRVVSMTPGSLLYVPRGHWHATRTLGMSIALSLNFEPFPLVDHLVEMIRERLTSNPVFRRNIQGLTVLERSVLSEGLRTIAVPCIDEMSARLEAIAADNRFHGAMQ